MTTYGLAVVLAAGAGALLPAPVRRSRRARPPRGSPGLRVRLPRAAAGWCRRRRLGSSRRQAEALREQMSELLDGLVAELRGGAAPAVALAVAAEGLPALSSLRLATPSVRDDPADLLRAIAARPGGSAAGGLSLIWAVAESTGCALATPVAALARGERESAGVRREVAAQLAGPRATSRLLLLLPVVTLVLGVGLGADPLGFLLETSPGRLCLAAGVALLFAGSRWTERIVRDAQSRLP